MLLICGIFSGETHNCLSTHKSSSFFSALLCSSRLTSPVCDAPRWLVLCPQFAEAPKPTWCSSSTAPGASVRTASSKSFTSSRLWSEPLTSLDPPECRLVFKGLARLRCTLTSCSSCYFLCVQLKHGAAEHPVIKLRGWCAGEEGVSLKCFPVSPNMHFICKQSLTTICL